MVLMALGGNQNAHKWFKEMNLGSFGNGLDWNSKYHHPQAAAYAQQLKRNSELLYQQTLNTLLAISPSITAAYAIASAPAPELTPLSLSTHPPPSEVQNQASFQTPTPTHTIASRAQPRTEVQKLRTASSMQPQVIFTNINTPSSQTSSLSFSNSALPVSNNPFAPKTTSSGINLQYNKTPSTNPFAPKHTSLGHDSKGSQVLVSPSQTLHTCSGVSSVTAERNGQTTAFVHTSPNSQATTSSVSTPSPLSQAQQNVPLQQSQQKSISASISASSPSSSGPVSTPKKAQTAEEDIADIMKAFSF